MPNLFFLYKANRLHLLYPIYYHIFNSLPIVGTFINNIYFFRPSMKCGFFLKDAWQIHFPCQMQLPCQLHLGKKVCCTMESIEPLYSHYNNNIINWTVEAQKNQTCAIVSFVIIGAVDRICSTLSSSADLLLLLHVIGVNSVCSWFCFPADRLLQMNIWISRNVDM